MQYYEQFDLAKDGQQKIHRGKFIVLYGINNLGKTTQAKMLVDKLKLHGLEAEYLKYPVYLKLYPITHRMLEHKQNLSYF